MSKQIGFDDLKTIAFNVAKIANMEPGEHTLDLFGGLVKVDIRQSRHSLDTGNRFHDYVSFSLDGEYWYHNDNRGRAANDFLKIAWDLLST